MTFKRFAWYLRYPALTISLYPPIFPVAEAIVFAIFGFSHVAAQATVSLFAVAAAFGMASMLRTSAPTPVAAAASVILFATPSVLLWSRQVVMEVPTMAFLLLAASMLLQYQARPGAWRLMAVVGLLLGAVYTKQTAIFAAPAFAVALFAEEGLALFRKRSTWLAMVGGIVGLLPLAAFTIMYASQNIDSAIGQGAASITGGTPAARFGLQAFIVYGRA